MLGRASAAAKIHSQRVADRSLRTLRMTASRKPIGSGAGFAALSS